jgi:hypothetical protein
VRDEGRPLAPGDQELGANRCMLLPSKAVVVSDAERTGRDPVWVRIGETSASEPPMNCRKRSVDVKTRVGGHPGRSVGGDLKPGPHGIRLEGGVTPMQALARNVRTCRLDAKGPVRAGGPGESDDPDARHRGGAVRSRGEGPVTATGPKGQRCPAWTGGQPATGGTACLK